MAGAAASCAGRMTYIIREGDMREDDLHAGMGRQERSSVPTEYHSGGHAGMLWWGLVHLAMGRRVSQHVGIPALYGLQQVRLVVLVMLPPAVAHPHDQNLPLVDAAPSAVDAGVRTI